MTRLDGVRDSMSDLESLGRMRCVWDRDDCCYHNPFDECVPAGGSDWEPDRCTNRAHDHSAKVELGAVVYSKSRYRADDDLQPVGGTVIDISTDDDGERHVRVVDRYRGRINYFTLPVADLEAGMSGAHVNTRSVKSLLLALGEDAGRQKDPLLHHHAATVLAGVLVQHTA